MAGPDWVLVGYAVGTLVTAEVAKRRWGMDWLRQTFVALAWPVVWPIFFWARMIR